MWVEALRAQPHRRPTASPVRYSRYPEAPPTSGEWEGHGADQLAYADEELYEWLLGLSAGGEEAQPGVVLAAEHVAPVREPVAEPDGGALVAVAPREAAGEDRADRRRELAMRLSRFAIRKIDISSALPP